VRELEKEYEGRVRFEIVPVYGREQEVRGFDLGNHGLVGFDAGGNARVFLRGHQYGRAEVAAKVEELLRVVHESRPG
jgi:hypothetical protein